MSLFSSVLGVASSFLGSSSGGGGGTTVVQQAAPQGIETVLDRVRRSHQTNSPKQITKKPKKEDKISSLTEYFANLGKD